MHFGANTMLPYKGVAALGNRRRLCARGWHVGIIVAFSCCQGGRKGEVPIRTSWPFLLPLAPCAAASLLPTCCKPETVYSTVALPLHVVVPRVVLLHLYGYFQAATIAMHSPVK